MVSTPDKKVDILGKWLVFKHYDEIDETWDKIRTAIVTDKMKRFSWL